MKTMQVSATAKDSNKNLSQSSRKEALIRAENSWLKHPFWFFIKRNKRNFLLGMLTLLITNIFDVIGPFFIGKTIDFIAQNNRTQLYIYLVILLGISIFTAIFRYLWRIYFSRFHQQAAADLRNILFKKMMSLGLNFHHKTATGEKMTLLTQDIDNFRMGVGPGMLIFADALIYVLGLLPLMLMVSFSWTWKCLILMPLIPFLIYRLENAFVKRYRLFQDETGELTSFAQETVSGVKVIKSLSLQSFRSQLFSPINLKLQEYGLKVDRIESAFSPLLEFFVMIGTATLLFVGAKDVISGQVTIGEFFAFYQYLLRMIWPMTAFGFSFMMFKEADSSFARIKEVLVTEPEIPPGELSVVKGHNLEVKDLSFTFGGNDLVIKKINFTLNPSESLAIVGPVGSGKSTLIQLLSRSLPIKQGSVTYNNTPLIEVNKNSYKNILTHVPQEIFLFKSTVKENLTNFTHSTDAEVLQSLKDVELLDEILKLEKKEDTLLQEKGQGLSGGQRQRLTLARGLLIKPQWLALDDSLSAVDIETEHKIMRRLQKLKEEHKMNFIISSHRIQNLKWVDKILVLDNGYVIDSGTHDELIQRSDLYRSLYTSHKTESNPKTIKEGTNVEHQH